MILEVPAPRRVPLPRAPLTLAVCQMRYETVASVSENQSMLAIQEELGGRNGLYPKAEKLQGQQLTFQMGAGGPQSLLVPAQSGWRLLSRDGTWIVALMPDNVSLETTRYSTWEGSFQDRLSQVAEAVMKHIKPEIEQRLGLRYVNQLNQPRVTTPQGWSPYITPELLGAALHKNLGPGIKASLQQLDLDAGSDMHCSLRHGFSADSSRDGALTYLLDIDVYREGVRRFDVADIMMQAQRFNDLALTIFQQAITPEMLAYLGEDNV